MQMFQKGRSMIEMLGVLAIIGVLSIGGLLGYRRAVNNHQANTILDDVNRFAFVILERSGLALGDVVPEGDFVKNSTYQLEGYQDVEPEQFSITVFDVPRGVCEALLPKAIIEYKVRVNPSANEQGKLYDTLNTDLCLDNNFMVFYFGDTTGVCNVPDDDGPTPCTQNGDCCGGEFCVYTNATKGDKVGNGPGECNAINPSNLETVTLSNGQRFTHSLDEMNGYSAQSWCEALGLNSVTIAELGCSGYRETSTCSENGLFFELLNKWKGTPKWHWANTNMGTWYGQTVALFDNRPFYVNGWGLNDTGNVALCH